MSAQAANAVPVGTASPRQPAPGPIRVRPPAPTPAPAALAPEKVVPLFSEASAEPNPAGSVSEQDWSGALQLVRDVAGRARTTQQQAHQLALRAQKLARQTIADAEAAEERARAAEAAAGLAVERATRAEEHARLMAERVQAAEEKARAAEAELAEAHVWLKRLNECLKNEFHAMTVESI